ncbi:MAG: hypothetical protein ACXW6J_15780 [Candidatus Binatia bacterium]
MAFARINCITAGSFPARGITRYVNIKEHSDIGVDGFPAAASATDGELFYQTVLTELEKVVRELQQEA